MNLLWYTKATLEKDFYIFGRANREFVNIISWETSHGLDHEPEN